MSETDDALAAQEKAALILDILVGAGSDPLFLDASAPDGGNPAGTGHAPFAAWLAAAIRPRAVLGAGRDMGALHDAIAAALGAAAIPAALLGHPFEGPDTAWAHRHRARFGAFSRMAGDAEALPPAIPFDLAHVDAAGHAMLRARADLRLSPRAVLLVRGAGAGGEDTLFLHDGGLALLALGDDPPPLVRALCEIRDRGGERLARLRLRFAALGERLLLTDAHAQARAALLPLGERLAAALGESGRRADTIRLMADRERETARATDAVRRELEAAAAALAVSEAARATLAAALAAARSEPEARATTPPPPAPAAPRFLRDRLRRSVPPAAAPAASPVQPPPPAPAAPPPPPAPDAPTTPPPRRTVLFVAGEPGGAGEALRCVQQAAACADAGWAVRIAALPAVGPATIAGIDMLVLWRAPWSEHVRTMIAICRAAGAAILFDLDDLVIDPALAQPAVIDGMRLAGIAAAELAPYFERLRETARAADLCVATTDELASHFRAANLPAVVIPNGFDAARLEASRLARRARAVAAPCFMGAGGDGRLRIGYAAGTRTHQADFAACTGALVRLAAERPDLTLVLFRDAAGEPLVTFECPTSLDALADRIEWRDAVPFAALPAEIARFDIAICPLETGNPFCESKSEWKYVEAALASVPCVASPTGPLRRAIRDGETGFLAADAQGWYAALAALAGDADLRARVGAAALAHVLWRFGPQRRAELWRGLLDSRASANSRARGWEMALGRGQHAGFGLPAAAPTLPVWAHDTLRAAPVAVAITSFNYAAFVVEALDSVAAQTLEALELVVIDDCSIDDSLAVITAWAQAHAARFTRIRVERTVRNAGLGPARNAAFAAADAPHIMSLDADNRLRPACCEALHALLLRESCAFAYSTIPQFGDMQLAISALPYEPARFIRGNYIDAMALVAKWAWAAAGGYYDNPDARGWEDFDLWCRLAELGQGGVWHPEPLCEYRVHGGSMTNAVTERDRNKRALVTYMEERHPWLEIGSRGEALR